jgi:hypothetical protein
MNLYSIPRPTRFNLPRLLLTVLSALAFTVAAHADFSSKKTFSLPAGDATSTLKNLAEQSGEQITFPAEQIRGVQTNAVQGELSTREALDALVANTGLVVVEDKESGGLTVRKSAVPDEEASISPKGKTSIPVEPVSGERSKTTENAETIVLSPFEVQGDSKGYYASSSLSGTRINSKLEDLAASISVVTRQQLIDTAALDINDVFKYESNTEGMSQFTDFTLDRTFYKENTTLNPQSANRIRGLNSANTAMNNFAVSGAIPFDTYNISSIEISRGPNANIFGLGNASGTVNVNTAQASLTRDNSEIIGRADSYGGKRSSFNLNRVLWKNRAAIMVAGLYDEKGFEREPAYETVRRFTVGTNLKPFKSTSIHGSFESYRNRFSRANTTLPRDSISEWMANGQPVWNPTVGASGSWRYLNGSTYTAVTAANESNGYVNAPANGLPLGLQPGGTGFWANPSVYIERNGQVGFYGNNAVASNATSPATASSPVFRYVETGSIYRRGSDIRPSQSNPLSPAIPLILFQPLSVTDKSIYDYTSVNIGSPNFGRDKADTYQIDLEQWIINSAHNKLALQLGYYNERVNRYNHAVFSDSDNAAPYVAVDVNEVLIDGTPNPYYLRPYIGGSQPTIKYGNERNGDARSALAYQFDLTDSHSWLKWLGHHNLVAYGERRDMRSGSYTARDLNVTDYTAENGFNPVWTTGNALLSIPVRDNTYRIYPRYYIGGPVSDAGSVVDYAPASNFSRDNLSLAWFAATTRNRITQDANIQEVVQSGTPFNDREILTQGATWQGFFWNDRIVTTAGWRYDRNRQRTAPNINSNPLSPTQPSSTIDPNTRLNNLNLIAYFPNPWVQKQGQSRNAGIVFKAFPWLNLNYSQSNSFKPESIAYDINTRSLPNPTTKTKDYGFTLKLMHDELVARVTRYETVEKNSRNGSITSAAVTRTLRLFFDPGTALATPTSTGGYSSGNDSFDLEQMAAQWYLQSWIGANPNTPIPPEVDAAAKLYAVNNYLVPLGITQEFINRVRVIGASGFTDVNTVTSTGVEFEIAYNPNQYWTLKITGAQQKAVDTELGNAVTDFIASRWDGAHAIIVPNTPVTAANSTAGKQWWMMGATSATASGTNTPSGFYVANVRSVIGLATANAGKPRTQTREYQFNLTTNYRLAGLFSNELLKRTSIGGSARWASKASVSYYGMPGNPDPEFKGAIVDYDPNRPIYDKARTYVDFKIAHDLRFLKDRIRCKLQLNVNNVFEDGHLQPFAYNPDGTAWGYRIVDPRQFILTATFDL